ncbi:hypothetical protein ACFQET_10410 [Levilactobacillus tangyuanensis]|uniref:Uncharacterized protein n=1 Tax=Levilactobacillus tangyuanensis TaxID=2486021 RepID=A0ABW1TQI6_9LACO
MFKKAILLGTLAALGTAGGMTLNTQNVVAKAYKSPKTLKGLKYTHTTPKRSRGTWYNWDKDVGASKIVVKKHQVKKYYRQHKHGKWLHDETLTGKKLYVYRQKQNHKQMFGFYAAYEDDFSFYYTGTRKLKGKTVKYMSMAGLYTYYKSWKYAIK